MNWRQIQKTNITKLEELINYLNLDPLNRARLIKKPKFPLNLPLRLATKIEKNNLNDPLLKQFIALDVENIEHPQFHQDPVEDQSFQITPRLLKKYTSRALMLPTSACVMHCRYCFRKNYPYELAPSKFEAEIAAIKKDNSLREIILSGGDPLSLSDQKLESLLLQLNEIDHLKIIRFHTRFPIGIPERISPELISTLSKLKKKIVFIFHINHPNEIDDDIKLALQRLSPYQLLNQSVLLKDVNDSLPTLQELSYKLNDSNILPYYLHQLDRVQGTAHFEVTPQRGLQLIEQMRESMPGYLVPKYVQEIPQKKCKTPIAENLVKG
ncbi:MAG: KamA family radical SAM protein [Rhabdochlamydiaceae bacterium]|nr:KamA family radical SAM protein [Candidatus Amphrikana amoebophyrae]